MEQELNQIFEKLQTERDILQKAKLILFLKREKELQTSEIGKRMGLKTSYVSHLLRLNKLPALVIDGYYSKTLSPTHLFILSRLSSHEEMIQVYEQILLKNLTVLDTEKIVRQKIYGIKDVGDFISEKEIEEFRQRMNKKNIKITVNQSHIKGKISFEIVGNLEETSNVLRDLMRKSEQGGQAEEESRSDFE